MKAATAILPVMIILAVPLASAHTTVAVGPYEIEVGWGLEPPVVGVRNTIVLSVTEPSTENPNVRTGLFNAFANMDATVYYGGVSKALGINSETRPGFYFADIIPTRPGTYAVDIQGTLNGVPVDISVSAEDVESSALLDFPPAEGSSNQEIEALKATVAFMQNQMESQPPPEADPAAGGAAYDIAVMGVSMGVSAVILSIVALVRRPRI